MVAVIVSLLLHHIHSACSVVLEPLSLWMNTGPDQGWSVPSALAPQHLMGDLSAPTIAGHFRYVDDAPNFGDSLSLTLQLLEVDCFAEALDKSLLMIGIALCLVLFDVKSTA